MVRLSRRIWRSLQSISICRIPRLVRAYFWCDEELRNSVIQMRRDGLSPKQFGLYVRAHPDALTVTALNKMRNAETRPLQISFNGKLIETHILPAAADITEQNQELFRKLYALLESRLPQLRQRVDGAYFGKQSIGKLSTNFFSSTVS